MTYHQLIDKTVHLRIRMLEAAANNDTENYQKHKNEFIETHKKISNMENKSTYRELVEETKRLKEELKIVTNDTGKFLETFNKIKENDAIIKKLDEELIRMTSHEMYEDEYYHSIVYCFFRSIYRRFINLFKDNTL